MGSAVERSCTANKLSGGSGYVQETVTMPVSGSVVANLMAASGDWDVAIFKADGGQVVAGSASRGARELAEGYSVRRPEADRPGLPALGQRLQRRPERPVVPDRHDRRAEDEPRARLDPVGRPQGPAREARPRRDGERRRRLGRRRAQRRGGRDKARQQQLRLHDSGPGPDACRRATTARPTARSRRPRPPRSSRAGGRPTGACSTTRTSMKRLARENPDLVQADHPQPPDLRGPAGRGHRDRDEPERPRRPAGVPAARRPPRA